MRQTEWWVMCHVLICMRCLCRQAQAELHRIAAREANQARSGASQMNAAAGFTEADMLAAAKVCVRVADWLGMA